MKAKQSSPNKTTFGKRKKGKARKTKNKHDQR